MHNSAACILRDGELLAFVEEERFTHIKQFGGFPQPLDPVLSRDRGNRAWERSITLPTVG